MYLHPFVRQAAGVRKNDRRWAALVAFVGHVPGLRLCTRFRLGPRLRLANGTALLLTVVAMGWALVTSAAPLESVLIAWLVGHFAWSVAFSVAIVAGAGGFAESADQPWADTSRP